MSHTIICEVVAALMKGKRTRRELGGMCLGRWETQTIALEALREAGLVYIADWEPSKTWLERGARGARGACWPVYALQQTPFEHADAPHPAPTLKAKRAMAAHAVRECQGLTAAPAANQSEHT